MTGLNALLWTIAILLWLLAAIITVGVGFLVYLFGFVIPKQEREKKR